MATPPGPNLVMPDSFLEAVRQGNAERIAEWLEGGYSKINYQEAGTGMTALHYAAARNAVPIIKLLLRTGNCDGRIRDRMGRTAATLAIEVADNPVLGRYLYDLQFKQIPERQPDEDAGRRAR
ncbi:ankyrin repeat domain-containing protein [Phaeovulum sp.]|uniref:ankyrin repeat domain-containing protein n=1 Tax=Phaeovulum sp. TaxID=2934796 RepID=UPI00356550C9